MTKLIANEAKNLNVFREGTKGMVMASSSVKVDHVRLVLKS